MDLPTHWDRVYKTKGDRHVSWYRPHLDTSLALIEQALVDRAAPVLDVGAGVSTLLDDLLRQGFSDLTALDISAEALSMLRGRLGSQAKYIIGNIIEVELPAAHFLLWHDRAVFHFMTDAHDRQRYLEQLNHALAPGGFVVIGTFGPNGPDRCSGLPTARYRAADLTELLGHDFRLIGEREERHVTPASIRQPFSYGLWQLERGGRG